MKSLNRLMLSLGTSAALSAMVLVGCGSPKSSTATTTSNLTGNVKDETGAPVVGAVLSNAAGTQTATTDAAGHYAFALPTASLGDGAISAAATAYSTAFSVVPPNADSQDFTLRHYDTETQVMLPTDATGTAVASVTRADGKIDLTIPHGALVTPSGAVATGAATVKLTYWHPINDLNSIPASLVAHLPKAADGTGPFDVPLQTLGMVDVQVMQGTDVLQVAAGQVLNLDHKLPAVMAQAMAQKPNAMVDPFLFYWDTTQSRWIADGHMTYDSNTTTLRAQLPHLTLWNYDMFQGWSPPSHCTNDDLVSGSNGCSKPNNADSVGGCLAGTALKKDGSAYANSTVRVWFFDNEHISTMDVPTDGSGSYCADLGVRMCVPLGNNGVNCSYTNSKLYYLVSGTDSANDSSMTNPIPSSCSAGNGGPLNVLNYYNTCGLVSDTDTKHFGNTTPTVTPASATIKVNTYCSNASSCATVPPVTIATDVPKQPGSATPAKPCTPIPEGGECSATVDTTSNTCCKQGTVCLDHICVSTPK